MLRVRFGNRRLDRFSVGGARGREDEQLHRLGRHRFEHAQRADDVVPVVLRRIAHRLADVEKGGEVHDARDRVAAQRVAERRDVGDVADDQIAVLHGGTMAGDEIVVHDHAAAGAVQRFRGVAADVAGAAGDQDGARATVQWRNT